MSASLVTAVGTAQPMSSPDADTVLIFETMYVGMRVVRARRESALEKHFVFKQEIQLLRAVYFQTTDFMQVN
jgi:hypothetical protein